MVLRLNHTRRCQTVKSILILQDKPKRVISRDIIPRPVDKNNEFIAHTEYKHQVKKHPDKPSEAAFKFSKRQVHHCLVSANSSHGSKVTVFIRAEVILSQMNILKVFCQVFAVSYGNICHLRMPLGVVGGFHVGHVSDSKNIAESFHPVDPVHFYPSSSR